MEPQGERGSVGAMEGIKSESNQALAGWWQRRREAVIAPLCEAGLLMVAGCLALLTHQPFFFASLGPTAFELAETPERRSAEPYSILMGHFVAVMSGFAAIWLTGAVHAPAVSAHGMSMMRVWAAVVATLLTVGGTVLLRAAQPAALSTTLIVATGAMQKPVDGPIIMTSILLVTVLGEPLRRWRLGHRRREAAERSAGS